MKQGKKILAAVLSAVLLFCALPVTALSGAGTQDAYGWIEGWQTAITSQKGNKPLENINDGLLTSQGNTFASDKPEGYMDFYGYDFIRTYRIKQLVYYSGDKYGDGGWFDETPVVQIKQNGEWKEIASTVSPDFDKEPWKAYVYSFDPVECDGVRLYGKAGGSKRFVSCAELMVLGERNEEDYTQKETTRYEFEQCADGVKDAGTVQNQNMGYATTDEKKWSCDRHMFWKRQAENSSLSFSFVVAVSGKYDLSLQVTKAGDFGRFAFCIDDQQIGGEADLHASSLSPALLADWGEAELTAGVHTFTIQALSNEAGSLYGGFDYFELRRQPAAPETTEWIEGELTPIASVVRDGDLALSNIQDGDPTTMTDLFQFNKTEENVDYVGYTFPKARTISEIRYTEGKHYVDGGWFREAPEVKVYKNGEWVKVEAAVSPEYKPGRSDAWGEYTFTFDPVECEGVIVSGKPGGDMYFISCAELKVLAEKLGSTPRPEPTVTYSYADIASRLYDMEALAKIPDGETSAQFTSRDRSSSYDTVTGEYKNWDANGDWKGYIRKQDDGGYVIAEMEGPGFINRLWMAYGWTGRVKIYIDGGESPVLDERFVDLFTGDVFPYDQLRYRSVSLGGKMGGFDCYVPITYNESCKVVMYDSTEDTFGNFSYYIVGYTSLPDTCAVESFTYPLSSDNAAALQKADETLAARDAAPASGKKTAKTVKIDPGKSQEAFTAAGAGAVSFLEVKPDSGENLSDLILSIYWDGSEKPAVCTALGDFFATPAAVSSYGSYVTGVREDGSMYARWFMPYSDGVRIVLENRGDKARSADLAVTVSALSDDPAAYARFGAEWKRMGDREKGDGRWPDSQFLSLQGSGRFVGVSMHIYQIAQQIWWGEGDEKFFVDGEKLPSWFGTGSEDYFGYAWCQATVFNQPYHGQPLCEGARGTEQVQDPGDKVNYRWHVTDNVPFYKSFDANMEKYFNDDAVKMAATSFYYLTPEDSAAREVNRFTAEERAFNRLAPQEPALHYEGEALSPYLVACTNGTASIQDMGYATTPERQWSGNAQLWWKCGGEGGELSFTIQVPADGQYDLALRTTTANDYGRIAVSIGGQAFDQEVDCYSADLGVKETTVGRGSLSAGEQVVTLRCTGKNAGSKGYYIGLDCLELTPVAVAVERITLDRESLHLLEGQTELLTAVVEPKEAADRQLVWTSSDETVARVDENGRVTALAPGKATIRVTAAGNEEVSAVCEVVVRPLGDMDKDGEVTIQDVMEACKVLARKSAGREPTPEEMACGNLDGDNAFTITDVMEICKILARKA